VGCHLDEKLGELEGRVGLKKERPKERNTKQPPDSSPGKRSVKKRKIKGTKQEKRGTGELLQVSHKKGKKKAAIEKKKQASRKYKMGQQVASLIYMPGKETRRGGRRL